LPCADPNLTTFTVGPYCFGDTAAGCPDQIPTAGTGYGIRYNCVLNTLPPGQVSNLQTFLGVDPMGGQAMMSRLSRVRAIEGRASPKQIEEAVQRVLERKK
jgi:hypothetical protein